MVTHFKKTIWEDLKEQGYQLEETHISWVFLGKNEVWKIKKPVSFGFLDFSTLEKRKQACDAEVRLNRRLSPEIYLGVVKVTLDSDDRFKFGGKGAVVDYAVHMVRLPEKFRADQRLQSGNLSKEVLVKLAIHLADFHAGALKGENVSRYGAPRAVEKILMENLQQTHPYLIKSMGKRDTENLEKWNRNFFIKNKALLEKRVRDKRIRDGHGDFRLDQIYVTEKEDLYILDCIEFDHRFRFEDVCSDVSFLSMDLSAYGRRDLAEIFLATYARHSGDYELYRLLKLYECYRACVRGKIASLLAADKGATSRLRKTMKKKSHHYLNLALATINSQKSNPELILFAGAIGTGKSFLADRLGNKLAIPVISSDWTRKQMFGLPIMSSKNKKINKEIYSEEITDKVYHELWDRTKAILESGRWAIVDATFRLSTHRKIFINSAFQLGVSITIVECRASRENLFNRLKKREGKKIVSDARAELLEDFLKSWEPITEIPESQHIILDTNPSQSQTWNALSTLMEKRKINRGKTIQPLATNESLIIHS